jgi:hypothetical protein
MMARDVNDKLKELGFERGTAHLLQIILEQQSAHKHEMREMQAMLNKMTDILMSLTVVGEQMKAETERMQRKFGDRPDLPSAV